MSKKKLVVAVGIPVLLGMMALALSVATHAPAQVALNSGESEALMPPAGLQKAANWKAAQPYINRNAARLNAADATVIFGADGAVYMGFVAFSPAEGAVAVSRSTDGGLTWSQQSWATSLAGPGADKPTLLAANGSLH